MRHRNDRNRTGREKSIKKYMYSVLKLHPNYKHRFIRKSRKETAPRTGTPQKRHPSLKCIKKFQLWLNHFKEKAGTRITKKKVGKRFNDSTPNRDIDIKRLIKNNLLVSQSKYESRSTTVTMIIINKEKVKDDKRSVCFYKSLQYA